MVPTITEKKKRVSKKNKSSWRKHVDIRDVNEFLEEQRLEERLGDALSEVKNEDLFTLDGNSNKKELTAKERKRLRIATPPKCFSMLQSHTKVPDPIIKRNRLRTREERMCPILKRKETERKLKGILKFREQQSIRDRKKYEAKLKEEENDRFTKDIWDIEDTLDENEWIDKLTKRHILRGTGKLVKVSAKLKTDKNAAVPNIEVPHPGISYNPSFKDHTDLLMEIAKKETKIIKEEEHIKRVTKNMFKKVPAGETNNIWLKEMSQGLPGEEHLCNESESESDVGDDKPYKSVNSPVENKKKTRKQRRKQKEQILLMEKQLQAKLEKKKSADINKLNTINIQIENLEKKLEKQKLRREKLKSFKSKKPKQLGKLKYEEPDTVFSMKEDLSGNLRNLKVKGNLLSDRFTSFQKRNILAVTARHNRRKSKVKKFVKPGFKDDWKKTVASMCIVPTRK